MPEIGPRVSYRPMAEESASPRDLGLLEAEAVLHGAQQIDRSTQRLGYSITRAGEQFQRMNDVRDANEAESFAFDVQTSYQQWESQNINPLDPYGGDRGMKEIDSRSTNGWTTGTKNYNDLSRHGKQVFDQEMRGWLYQTTSRLAGNQTKAIREDSNRIMGKKIEGKLRAFASVTQDVISDEEAMRSAEADFVQGVYSGYVDFLNKSGYELDPADTDPSRLPAAAKENIASTISTGYLLLAKQNEKTNPLFAVQFLTEKKKQIDPVAWAEAMDSAQKVLANAEQYAKLDVILSINPGSESDAIKAANAISNADQRDGVVDKVKAHFKDKRSAEESDRKDQEFKQMSQFSQIVSAENQSKDTNWRVSAMKFIDDVEDIKLKQELMSIYKKIEDSPNIDMQKRSRRWARGMTDQDVRKMMSMRFTEAWGDAEAAEAAKPLERRMLENMSSEDYEQLVGRMTQLKAGIDTPTDAVTAAVRYALPAMQTNRSTKITPETAEYQYMIGMIAEEMKESVDNGTLSEKDIHAEAKRRGAAIMRQYKDFQGSVIDYPIAGTKTSIIGLFDVGGDEASSIRFLQMRDNAEARGLPAPLVEITGDLNTRLEELYDAKDFKGKIPWSHQPLEKQNEFLEALLSGRISDQRPPETPATPPASSGSSMTSKAKAEVRTPAKAGY